MSLKSADLFKRMDTILQQQGKPIVDKLQAVYLFEVRAKKGQKPTYFTVDLKNGNGSVKEGKQGKADCTFIMLDEDIMAMAAGKLDGNDAFMKGKMKIKGNMQAAMKFTPDVLPKDAKLWAVVNDP